MEHEFQVSVYFDKDWGDKQQIKREMARREAMRLRIMKQFKRFPARHDKRMYHVTFYPAPEDLGQRIKAFLKGKVGEADVRGRDVISEAEWRRARYMHVALSGDDADTLFNRKDERIQLNRFSVLCKTCGRADRRRVPEPYRVLDRIERRPQGVFRTAESGIYLVSGDVLDLLKEVISDQIEWGETQMVSTSGKPVKAKRRWTWIRPRYAVGADPTMKCADPCPACGAPRDIKRRDQGGEIFSDRARVRDFGPRDLDLALVPTWVNPKDPGDVIPSHTAISGRLFDLLTKSGVKSLIRPRAPLYSMRKGEPAYSDAERPFATAASTAVAAPKRKPVTPKPAVMSAADVRAFLKETGTFACTGDAGKPVALRVEHRVRPPAKDADVAAAEKALERELTPSHRRLLAITDGCALFADAAKKGDTGLVLYSARQLVRENRRMKQVFGRDAAEALADKLLVGEPVGYGDWIAVDFARTSKLGEPPIVYFDHEGGDRHGKVVAASFEDLLRALKSDPLSVFRKKLDDSVLYTDTRREMLTLKAFRKRS